MRLTNDRYEVIKKSVVKMFVENDIRQIPIDCFEICQKMCIKLRKYSQLTSDALLKAKEISEDGYCMLIKEGPEPFVSLQWYIFYDDTKSRERIRFTIMHEIGHVVLGHTEHSQLAESEANFFAKYSLAPPPLVHKIKPEDYMDISKDFDLSQECAYYAMSFYNKWLQYGHSEYLNYESELLSLFDEAV